MTEQKATAKKTSKKTGRKKKAKKAPPSPQRRDNVYVIELDDAIRELPKFSEANPNARLDLPCLYVGMTGLTPEQRFENHKAGKKAGKKYVTRFGIRLVPELYAGLNPMTREQAKVEEPALAERLRKRGFAVWQN